MEAFHKIKIKCPYEILEIEEIKIKNKPNEHGYLYLKGIVDDSINFKYAIEASTEDKICIYEETENEEESVIFNGTIQNISTNNNIDGIYHIEIEAYTSSFDLDIEEKSRSFQDADMSYDDLIKTMLLDYKIYSYVQCMERPISIGRPFFQYKETDLRFFIRTASYLGLQIYCDIIDPDNVFYFGIPSGREYEIEDDIDYSATLDINKYRESLVHNPESHPTDFFYYEIKTPKVMEIGAKVTFKQKEFYVYSYEAEYVRGELIYTYRLCRKRGIWQEKIYNDKLIGISLEGKVLDVSGEQVKLHLDIDETQNQAKAAWFRYAPPTGNIMYSMPIVGTSANLYFPNERNEEPIVIGCVRKNGSSCEKFSNVNNRYFSTESGNNLDMLPDAINFSRPGLSANFNDGSGITLSSSSSLSINAGYVGIFAGNVSIEGKNKLVAERDASFISLENDFYNDAGIIMENGSDRASNEPFDDDPQKGAAEAKAAIEAAVQSDVDVIAAAVEGSIGKIGECIFNGTENNSENVKDVRLGASPEGLSKDEMDSLPEYTETHTSPEFNNLGPDGVRAKYECNDGTIVTGKVILGSDILPTFIPDNRSEYNEHNSWFSKANFISMVNGVKASLKQQGDSFKDLFLAVQTPLVGWDTVKSQMAYEHEQTQKEVERLRNQSPSKRQFDNTNFASNVGFCVYDTVTGIKSIPKMWKMGKAAFGGIKNIFKNIKSILPGIKKSGEQINTTENVEEVVNQLLGGFCFVGDTLVLTKYGYTPIKDIKVGDEVYSKNVIVDEVKLKKVKRLLKNTIFTIINIKINNEEIRCTPTHPFWIVNKGWISAKDIKIGYGVETYNGNIEFVSEITVNEFSESIDVYNIEIEEFHTYYISNLDLLVHNGCSQRAGYIGNKPSKYTLSREAELLRNGGNNTTVNVKTKAEADSLLKEAFPDYQKVNGVGPEDPSGARKKRKMDRFKEGGAYHKDYAIDSETGTVRGHDSNNIHGKYPHINIKRKDGKKVLINITG